MKIGIPGGAGNSINQQFRTPLFLQRKRINSITLHPSLRSSLQESVILITTLLLTCGASLLQPTATHMAGMLMIIMVIQWMTMAMVPIAKESLEEQATTILELLALLHMFN